MQTIKAKLRVKKRVCIMAALLLPTDLSACRLLSFADRLHLRTLLPTPSINTNAKHTPLLGPCRMRRCPPWTLASFVALFFTKRELRFVNLQEGTDL
uniref:Uncharacterized protein n=1 Tax=Ixodes ricinus TaxID=34613 RepID=A0A6B0U710_IXORI